MKVYFPFSFDNKSPESLRYTGLSSLSFEDAKGDARNQGGNQHFVIIVEVPVTPPQPVPHATILEV